MKKIYYIVAVVVVILAALYVFKSPSKSVGNPVRIGGAFFLTGVAAKVGEIQRNGALLAVESLNNNLGPNDRKVELVIEDTGYDPKTAVSAYQALKFKGLHLFIIDGSPVVAATRQLVVDDGNFTIAGAATAPSYFDDNNRTCRISLTARNFGPAMAEVLAKGNQNRVAALLPDNEYGRGLSTELEKSLKEKGGTVVVSEFYDAKPGSNDFRTSITKLKSKQTDFDALVLSNPLNTLTPMLTQMKELGFNKPTITDNPTIDNPTLKEFSPMEGFKIINYTYSKLDLPTDTPEIKSFKDAYRATYKSDPVYFGAATYDIAQILAKAARTVGDDPQKIGNYVSSLKGYQGITGKFSFNSDCEVSRDFVLQTIKDGKLVDIK